MAHKTNYKDALFEQRKYRMQNNPDGTVTPIDETDYTQEGDRVGALELNEIGEALNALEQEMGKRELQTYTALSQLSLEAPVTLSQLITAMPDGSYAAIDCNGTSVVSDIPSGSAAGSLEVVKVGDSGSAKYTNTSNGQVYFWGNGQWYAALVDEMVLGTMEEIDANTDAGKVAGALAVKELNSELKFPDGTKFYPDMQDGEYGFNTAADRGADTFHPFSSFNLQDYELITYWATPRGTSPGNISDYPYTVSDDRDILVLTIFSTYAGSGIKCLLNGNAPENSIAITIPGQISIYMTGSSAATFNNAYIGLSYIKAKTGDQISLEAPSLTYTGITAIMGKK